MNSGLLKGAGLLLAAAVAWGGLFPVAVVALRTLDPFHMAAIRYSLAAALLVAMLSWTEGPAALRLEGRAWRAALLGTIGFAGLGLAVFVGLEYSRPEHGAVIMATQPLIAALAAWLMRGVKPARATLGLLGIALIGVVLVVTKGRFTGLFAGGTGFGDVLMLLGAISWVVYTLGAADFPSWSPLRYTTLTSLLSLPPIVGIAAVASASGRVPTPSAADVEAVAWQLAYIVGIGSILGVLAWNAGNRLVGAANGVLFINFVPVTVFAIRIAQGHRFEPIEFLGAALVIGALVANHLFVTRASPPLPAQRKSVAVALPRTRVRPQGCG